MKTALISRSLITTGGFVGNGASHRNRSKYILNETREIHESTSYGVYAKVGKPCWDILSSKEEFDNGSLAFHRRHAIKSQTLTRKKSRLVAVEFSVNHQGSVSCQKNRYLQNFHHHRRKNVLDALFTPRSKGLTSNYEYKSTFGLAPATSHLMFCSLDRGNQSRQSSTPPFVVPPSSNYHPPQRVGVVHCYEWCKDTGIASEQDWGINLKSQPVTESGVNEDGSSWYRESGEDLGDNGYRCRWNVMGGRNADGSVEWKETWWEKSDWSGYKELGAEKSGRNAIGDTWWETWQESYREDDSGLPRIEKSAHKQAKSGKEGIWNEKWWEKYNTKGWTDKGAHKYGRFSDQSWWEKWGEQYDGQGSVVKWTDKWAENDEGRKWGDKWEERFNKGAGNRQGETWNISPAGERWSRFWGEEHYGNGQVHKYGKSTSGELWDETMSENTHYQSEPHYGWKDALANSKQLLAIEIRELPEEVTKEPRNGATAEGPSSNDSETPEKAS